MTPALEMPDLPMHEPFNRLHAWVDAALRRDGVIDADDDGLVADLHALRATLGTARPRERVVTNHAARELSDDPEAQTGAQWCGWTRA